MGIGLLHEDSQPSPGGLSSVECNMLMRSPLIEGLPKPLQDELVAKGRSRRYQRGEYLFMDGDYVDYVFYLFSGKVREYFATTDGADCLRFLYVPGCYISLHMAMSGTRMYPYSCEVLRSSDVYMWKVPELDKLVAEYGELSRRMLTVLSSHVEASCRKLCLCRKSQSVSRVAGYLLSLDSGSQSGCAHFVRSFQTNVVANIKPVNFAASDVCMARETFSRALSLLQERNLIRVEHGHVRILDVEALKRVSDGI